MRTVIAAIVGMIAGLALLGGTAVAMTPCQTEDSTMCYWDAGTSGDGYGTSFVSITDDIVIYLGSVGVPECTDAIADAGGICHGEPK